MPLPDREGALRASRDTGKVLVIEEQSIYGGLAGAVAEVLLEEGAGAVKFRRMGLEDSFAEGYGSYQDMREMNGLSGRHIVNAARALM